MWKRKRKGEPLPWYRAPNYKGNITEAEKRQLDAFRMQPKHPSAQWDDLPEEVRNYIVRIELELYDGKQDAAAGRAFFWSAAGAVLLFLVYKGVLGEPTIWRYAPAALILIVPWIVYRFEWNKNAEAFRPRNTEERIREEWELNYIVDQKTHAESDASSDAS